MGSNFCSYTSLVSSYVFPETFHFSIHSLRPFHDTKLTLVHAILSLESLFFLPWLLFALFHVMYWWVNSPSRELNDDLYLNCAW